MRGLAPHPPVSIPNRHNKRLKFMSIFEPLKAGPAGLFGRN
jgi:hypothetical protein